MARNTRDTCRAILVDLQGRGFEQEATHRAIMESIARIAGETRATRERYMNALKKQGYIVQGMAGTYRLEASKVDDDSEMSMIGELTRRVTQLETAVAKLRKNKEAEHDG